MLRQYSGHLRSEQSGKNSSHFAHGLNFYQLFWIFSSAAFWEWWWKQFGAC